MRIFVKTVAPVLLFVGALIALFDQVVLPDLLSRFNQWAVETERSGATILAQSIADDVMAGDKAAMVAALGRVWANRPDWALVEVYDDLQNRLYPDGAAQPPASTRRISVRIERAGGRFGSLVVHVDESYRLQAIRAATRTFALWIAGLGVALLVFMLVLQFTYITRPIHRLRGRISQFARGQPMTEVTRFRNDEIGDLWRSFEDMRERLNDREERLGEARMLVEAENRINLELRERAEAASTAKSEFIAAVSHEFRTPLASVLGFSELLLNRSYDEPTRRDLTQTIQNQSKVLVHLVDELLDVARTEARAGRDFNLQLQPLLPVIQATLKELHVPDDLRVPQCGLPDSLPLVEIDEIKIRQALMNVLGNAYKYSSSGGTVEVRAVMRESAGGKQVGIAVTDHGIGMTPEQAARAFEKFYRADPSGNIPGAGLGLALVKEIMEIHRGSVELQSEPGIGTTVTLWLPVNDGASPVSRRA